MPSDVASRVLENRPLGAGYVLTTFEAPSIAESARPGQFVMAGSPDPLEILIRRPFSICVRRRGGSSEPATISILYRVGGRGTAFLSRLARGERAAILGPLGRGFTEPRSGETPTIVAGGIGIAAFPFLVEDLAAAGHGAVLLYGARTGDDLPMREWLEARVAEIAVTTDDGSAGEHGLVTAPLLRRLAERGPRRRLYVCGPTPMMTAVAGIAAQHRVPCEVALETPMACGYGVCVGCVVEIQHPAGEYGRYRRVCVDGPVFDAAEIRW